MVEEDITRELQLKKRLQKTQATKFVTFVESINKKSKNRAEIQRRYRAFEVNYQELQATFDAMIARSKDPETDTLIEEKIASQEQYYQACGKVDSILDPEDNTSTNSTQSAQAVSHNIQVKLPVLELPTFDGLPEEWLAFKDLFNSLINDNKSLSNVQKFHYLKSCLKGNASNVIQALAICDANYTVAWTMLKEQFENRKVIINTHLAKLFTLPAVEKESSISVRNHLNIFLKHVRALQAIEQPTIDSLLVYLSSSKLDSDTRCKWEEYCLDIELPTLENLTEFLNNRCLILESKNLSGKEIKKPIIISQFKKNTTSHVTINNSIQCPVCKNDHSINQCKSFNEMSIDQRYEQARNNNLCYNCLRKNHRTYRCTSRPCFKCNKKHHSLLHSPDQGSSSSRRDDQQVRQVESTSSTRPIVTNSSNAKNNTSLNTVDQTSQVLLGTVVINVRDNAGNWHECRTLIDSGSQSNIMTEEFANRLNIKCMKSDNRLHGIGGSTSNIRGTIETKIESRQNDYSVVLKFLVVNVITHDLPTADVCREDLCIPGNIRLADPTFDKPGKISMLLGAEIYFDFMCQGQIKPLRNGPILQKTLFGWIVSGRISGTNTSGSICNLASIEHLNENVTKFWELENYNKDIKCNMSIGQIESEKHFTENVCRTESGRFIVNLPFNDKKDKLGASREMALKRFYTMERRLNSNTVLHKQYSDFLAEYIAMGHMTTVEKDDNQGYYLPHHCVIKESSLTTKLRVVFDGSARTSTRISLNDSLHVGAPVQNTIFHIMLKFRKHNIVFTTDIEKMYRQVLVAEQDREFQKILWRFTPSDEVMTYKLNTVTYGTSCAPFLATRCLVQLAQDEKDKFPRACKILQEACYVDDIISGCENIEEAHQLKKELEELLHLGGFPLQKWRSNKAEIVNEQGCSEFVVDNATTKTLGLLWNSDEDTLHYSTIPSKNCSVTKRTILSYVSQLFDPLGLLGGIIVTAKILLQKLWQLNLHWDEAVPSDIYTTWKTYQDQLKDVVSFRIPRRMTSLSEVGAIELHGFCDSSERAYGACVYIKTVDSAGSVETRLLCAKSRIAPTRQQSIPRLELCSAVLLAELTLKVREVMDIKFNRIVHWTDASIVLAWLARPANFWNTFVANRVSVIHELTDTSTWRHVRTHDNPADIISRGIIPSELVESELWWHGPQYLKLSEEFWPVLEHVNIKDIPEVRPVKNVTLVTIEKLNLIERFSSYSKLNRITAYCMRFINNCRRNKREFGTLKVSEINSASVVIMKVVQLDCFQTEVRSLQKGEGISRTSKLLPLNPFLDEDGVLRVGGRLHNAEVPFNQRHPVILPSRHHYTSLVITHEHLRHLHAGPRAVLAAIRTKYWPLSGMNVVKGILRECVRCCRARPIPVAHLMGNLPSARVRPSRPFSTSGVDYCGPFNIRQYRRRGAKTTKAYVAVFVCFATKAIHLELVSDLTTEACLSAIRRFISRRGVVTHLYSDNATNFVGSNNELKRMMQAFAETEPEMLKHNIQWHFIPARSPHFGGIWESAVKSCKHHLRRVAGDANLTYEEFLTLLAQVEACVNSRPLVPLSEDPNDMDVLTPGHFLIGGPITSPPEEDLRSVAENRLSHWQRVQQLVQHFWKRWSTEVLSQLQTRNKWKEIKPPLQRDTLVTIRDENLPPLKWKLGRVIELHPGKDGINRVATVKTATNTVKITVTKLCPIPVDVKL